MRRKARFVTQTSRRAGRARVLTLAMSLVCGGVGIAVGIGMAVTETRVQAQPMMGGGGGMPDLRVMNGKPLPDRGLAPGTVTVRVARKMPVNAVAGAEVSAIIKNAGGDLKKRTAKTDASGRAIFEGVGAGDQFQAQVTVDGELIKTSAFPMPSEGGVRTMLIAGLGPAPAAGEAGGGEAGGNDEGGGQGGEGFSLGASTGTAVPAADLPAGTLEVRPFDQAGHPLPNQLVLLGAALQGSEGKLKITRVTTNAAGLAKITGLATGASIGYAAVVDHRGIRLGTQPFTMPEVGGVRAEIRALERTSDASVISIGSGGRIILQMHEEVLQVLEMLPIENHSDKLFDPGVGGVEIPLPKGFVNAEAGEGDRKLEVRKNYGIAVHGAIAPKTAANNEITFGFTVPYHGSTHELVQPLPNGLGTTTLITEQVAGISVEGPGVGARQSREVSGRKYWVMPLAALAPGQPLRLVVTGLPSPDNSGRIASGGLALLLVAASVIFGRRPAGTRKAVIGERDKLIERREELFTQLLAAERERRGQNGAAASARADAAGAGADAGGAKARRNQLVTKLETVYRELAALDEPQAP
jgi:hypothetical protein